MNAELFHVVLEAIWFASTDAIVVVDARGQIVCCNQSVEALFGWAPEALEGRVIETIMPAHSGALRELYHEQHVADAAAHHAENASLVKALCEDGSARPVEVSWSAFVHEGQRYAVALVRDASARHAHEERLRELSFRDALTGVYNRLFMEEELDRLERGRRWPVSLIMLDVDGLKEVNDTRGHDRGDALIQRAARALCEAVRAEDFVARMGGDEFVAVLPGVDQPAAEKIAARVIGRCDQSPGDPALRVSVGVATGQQGANLRDVLREADARMYAMKRAHRADLRAI